MRTKVGVSLEFSTLPFPSSSLSSLPTPFSLFSSSAPLFRRFRNPRDPRDPRSRFVSPTLATLSSSFFPRALTAASPRKKGKIYGTG